MRELTERELEKAEQVGRDNYPPETECAVCSHIWMRHKGARCPANPPGDTNIYRPGQTTFLPVIDGGFGKDDFSLIM